MRPSVTGTLIAGATALGVSAILLLNPTQTGTSVIATMTSTLLTAPSTSTPSGGGTAENPQAAVPTSVVGTSADGTYAGSVYQSPYGPMQVQATVSDGKVAAIEWLQLPGDRHSQEINDNAAPALVEEGITAQSADVATVGGATYTSEGFQESLQAALSQAGL